jgi:hypothetical protein
MSAASLQTTTISVENPFPKLRELWRDIRDFFDDPIIDLQTASRDTLDFFEGAASLSAADWVLLALAAVALYWIWASVWAMTRLGPVEVETFEYDTRENQSDPVEVKALSAALREELSDNGVSPTPAVPSGTPQVNVIDAVEASGIPQSAFIAKLLKLLPKPPRPPQYKVTGVLIGVESRQEPGPVDRYDVPAPAEACGISYWVSPSREGSARLETVERRTTHAAAVSAAAFEIYRHISNDAIHVFPVWARWKEAESLKAYRDGCRNPSGNLNDAVADLTRAMTREPYNALAPLQLANLYEANLPASPACDRAHMQAYALRRYLRIASDSPSLVEARYRASLIAGALATTLQATDTSYGLDGLTLDQQSSIRAELLFLGLPPTPAGPDGRGDILADARKRLRRLAEHESKAVLQLLKPWYPLVRERRLRNQFEPKAHERRQAKHTVSISKHCVHMRNLLGSAGLRSWIEEHYRGAAVHVAHMVFGRGALNWQAHYNTACFDSLLLQHLRDLQKGVPRDVSLNWWRRWLVARQSRARRAARVRDRTLHRLNHAFKEAGPDLELTWVRHDPDFAVFMQSTGTEDRERWDELMLRIPEHSHGGPGSPTQQPLTPPREDPPPVSLPPLPWGRPRWRIWAWGAVLVVALALLVIEGVPGLLVLACALLIALSSWRLYWLDQERRSPVESLRTG